MRIYRGQRCGHAAIVTVDGRPLDPRLDLWNHSPTGFEWGYAGSGPAQLALALLADYFGDDDRALETYQVFKFAVVATLNHVGWQLTGTEQNRGRGTALHPPSEARPAVLTNRHDAFRAQRIDPSDKEKFVSSAR